MTSHGKRIEHVKIMRQQFSFSIPVWAIAALSIVLVSPARAQFRQMTRVDIMPTDGGLVIDLEASHAAQARIFEAAFGNTVILDLPITQLVGGVASHQAEPINGIESISVEPLDANSVRIRIVGTAGVPTVATSRSDTGFIVNVTPVRRQLQISCRRCPPPDYPESALREGIEGDVRIRVTFDAEGHVIGARIEGSSGNVALDQAALEAVLNFEFDVQSSDNQGGSISIEIPFTIPNEPPIQDEPPIQE
ncbi:MAG: TonB family protein [Cyanobacteria bacterium P01_A01_bin.123]